MLLLSSCEHHEPVNPIKPVDERTVLVLTHDGYIFDQYGELVAQLPNCQFAAEIISETASGTPCMSISSMMWTTGPTALVNGIIISICLIFPMC